MNNLLNYFTEMLDKSKPEFNNRPNQCILGVDGKQYWISRSPAVVAVVFAIHKDNIFVMAEKRSSKMEDSPNKWAVPSGYLDWDETGSEAVERELWEELKFFKLKYDSHLIADNDEQPFYVNTNPTENRQNVALTYGYVYDFSDSLTLPKLCKSDEVSITQWIPIDRVKNSEMYDWAFSHDDRIEMAVTYFKKYLQEI